MVVLLSSFLFHAQRCLSFSHTSYLSLSSAVAQWLKCRPGDRGVLGSNPAGGTSLLNFGNSIYPTLPASFGGDAMCRCSLLYGVYARGSNSSHTGCKGVTCRGLHNSFEINHSYASPRMGCLACTFLSNRDSRWTTTHSYVHYMFLATDNL